MSHSLLDRVDAILAAFDASNRAVGLAGLVARTGLPKTTVYRTTEHMVQLGWLHREAGGYVVGARLCELASLATVRARVRDASLPFMEDLYVATRETVHLAVLEDTHVRCTEEAAGHLPATGPSRVGWRMPAYCTAAGKVLIAFSPPEVLERVISRGLPPRTPATITSPQRLRAAIARVREKGVAIDYQECEQGLTSVAAPVLGADFNAVGAMSVSGSPQRLRPERLSFAVRMAALSATRVMRQEPS
ncbi:MAG: IclR family transcriptional regulator [Streptosporangiaceae bacterium]